MQGTQGDDCPLRGLGREEFDGPADGDVHAWERAATATATATGTASVAANADGSNRSNGPDGPGATASTWSVSGRKHGSDVRMQILFTGTDNDEQSCALLISLPSFFSSPLLAMLLPLLTEDVNQLRLFCFLIFSHFLFAAGRCIISSIVLNSLSQRHDNFYLSSQVDCRGLSQSRWKNCNFPVYSNRRHGTHCRRKGPTHFPCLVFQVYLCYLLHRRRRPPDLMMARIYDYPLSTIQATLRIV